MVTQEWNGRISEPFMRKSKIFEVSERIRLLRDGVSPSSAFWSEDHEAGCLYLATTETQRLTAGTLREMTSSTGGW